MNPVCMDAHHVDPSEKDLQIAEATKQGYSLKRLNAELQKCVCVCANCHRKIHVGKLNLETISEEFNMQSRQIFMILVGPTGAVFVKEHEFFKKQGGFEDEWGINWVPIVSTSVEAAREKACKQLLNARPYDEQAKS